MSIERTLVVHERLHHGSTFHERDIEIPATWAGFVQLLETSPYCYGRDAANNPYSAKSFADLLNKGRCEVGWSNFKVVEKK